MEYVDPEELGNVVTFCFSYFLSFPLPLIIFFKGTTYPVIICLEAFFFLSFHLLFALI